MAIARIGGSDMAGSVAAYRWATGLLAFALLPPTLVLLGWIFRIPVLRGLGNPHYSIAPLITWLFLLIAIAAVLAHRRMPRRARGVVALPLALLLLLAIQYAARFDLGLERLMFADQLVPLHVVNRGVPGLGAVAVFLIDCVAVLLMTSASTRARTWVMLLASTSIGLTALTVTMMVTDGANLSPSFIGRSAVSTLPNFALAVAIVLHVLSERRPREDAGFEYVLLRQLSPAIIVLPVLPSLVALLTVDGQILTHNEAHFLVVTGNVLIVLLLLVIGLRRAKQQNEAVSLRERQLRAILAGVPDAVIVVDRHGVSREFSAAAARLWAISPDKEPGCNVAEYLGDREGAKLARLLAGSAPQFLLTGEGVREDGARFPLELRGAMFLGMDDEICFTLFARDLSEKLAAEQHVARLGAQLAHVSRHNAMGELAADLAHELNQPLTAAINYLSAVGYLLGQREGTDKAPEMVAQARGQVSRAGEIIRRMRDFAQHRDVQKHVEPLQPMIDDAIQLVLVGSGPQDVEIDLAVEPAGIEVFVDRIQVQQVMVNLLRNAVEAIRSAELAGGRIVIAAHPIAGDWVEVEFRDDGPGVPESILDQLFERFTSTKAGAGMGIGLSISRRIVEAHGGTMRAVNGEGGGASFCFTLPAVT
ncbi:MAG TPA: ATP-binding protein, partial [Sphingomonas sp.]|nr:ATP-binding protein [Sphingomonas sp.]